MAKMSAFQLVDSPIYAKCLHFKKVNEKKLYSFVFISCDLNFFCCTLTLFMKYDSTMNTDFLFLQGV